MKKFLVLLLAPVVLAGCTSVSNLTPGKELRNAAGSYTVEAKWKTKRQAVRPDSIRPVVIVDGKVYPLDPVPIVKDRWEGQIPVPQGVSHVKYQFQFDYELNAFGSPKSNSVVSPEYQLHIVDR
jgi:uncharacterized protein YceK